MQSRITFDTQLEIALNVNCICNCLIIQPNPAQQVSAVQARRSRGLIGGGGGVSSPNFSEKIKTYPPPPNFKSLVNCSAVPGYGKNTSTSKLRSHTCFPVLAA